MSVCDCQRKPRWRKIPGVADFYRISSQGLIKRLEHISSPDKLGIKRIFPERLVKASPGDASGHLYVEVHTCSGKKKTFSVHRLVLLAFSGPPEPGQECRHLDGRSGHNCLSNLRWGTSKENAMDRKRHGTQRTVPRFEFDNIECRLSNLQIYRILSSLDRGKSVRVLAKKFKVTPSYIYDLGKGSSRRRVFAEWERDHKRVPKVKTWKKLSHAQIVQLQKLRDIGWSIKKLASQFFYNTMFCLLSA